MGSLSSTRSAHSLPGRPLPLIATRSPTQTKSARLKAGREGEDLFETEGMTVAIPAHALGQSATAGNLTTVTALLPCCSPWPRSTAATRCLHMHGAENHVGGCGEAGRGLVFG
jgi:hypothetical protein